MRRQTPQSKILLPCLFALALFGAGCGLTGTDADDVAFDPEPFIESEGDAEGDAAAGSEPGADVGDPSSGSVGSSGSTDRSGSAGERSSADSFVDDGVVVSVEAEWEGACTIDEAPGQPVHAVFDIPADDPDGGLNMRTGPGDGDVIRALPNGELVHALDCLVEPDGGVWWLVDDLAGNGGFVNARWLTEDLSASTARPRGGSEAEEWVTRLLDALAAEDWSGAVEAMGDGVGIEEIGRLPENGIEPAALAEYCLTRFCDAPYTVVEATGTYHGRWGAPSVSVLFDYPDGPAVETFPVMLEPVPGTTTDGLEGYAITGVRGLPGRSAPGLRDGLSATATIAGLDATAEDGLLGAADQVRRSLLAHDGSPLPAGLMAPEGVVVSLHAYVDPNPAGRVSVTAGDLVANRSQRVLWGFADGTGFPVVETVEDHLAGFRTDLALLEPDEIGIDGRIGLGNTIDNLAEVFPEAEVVEFHRSGRGDLSGFNWSSVRMVFEPSDGGWVLVALVSDGWTI